MSLIKKAAEKTAPIAKKAAQKAAPATAEIMLKTGQAALKAGSVAAQTGSKAIAEHTRRREEKEQIMIDGLKEKYPGCKVLLSKYNPDDEYLGGTKSSFKTITAYEMYDEYYALQYSAEGVIDIEYGRRKLNVYDKNRNKIGSCTEHGIRYTIVSIVSDGDRIMDVKYQHKTYEFSDLRYEYMKEKSSKGILIGRSGRVLMEIRRIKGYEVIAVVDPARTAASMLLYTAIKLHTIPRPTSGGAGG